MILNKNHPYFYHLLLLTLVLAGHTLQRFFGFGLNSHIIFFLAITLTIGVFHGMLDIILLQNKPFTQKYFLQIYAALALATCGLVGIFYGAAVIVLLVLSVWHFGEQQGKLEDTTVAKLSIPKQSIFRRVVLGASPLAAAFLLGGDDITVILTTVLHESAWLGFSWLGFSWLKVTWLSWQALSYSWLLLFAIHLLLQLYKQRQYALNVDAAEIAVVWFAFLMLPPLVAFSLYFGAYHALRHIRDVLASKNVIKTHQKALLLTALASAWMLGGLLWLFAGNASQIINIFSSQTILQATIVLLVAITLPHAILISFWRNSFRDKSL
jgi:Brp/Blh family beta-carotene 15,15'-monooxygenase